MQHSQSLAEYFKSGHSLSFDGHNTETVEVLRSRSAALLPGRGPSLPVTAVDQSVDMAVETALRRSLHSRIMTQDTTAFRRKCASESASVLLKQRKEMQTLLGDMHPTKDIKDIDKSKKFTFSLRRPAEEAARKEKEEEEYLNLKPIHDFLRPDDARSPRSTGYEHGHIRSLLKLDIYGPSNSLMASIERGSGKLPLEPNVDRYKDFRPLSPATSRPSTASSDDMWIRSSPDQATISSAGSGLLPNMTANLSGSGDLFSRSKVDTKPLSLRKPDELQTNNSRILTNDRLQVDAFVRRKEFQRSHYQRLDDTRRGKQQQREADAALRKKAALAKAERAAIRSFESSLTLSKFRTGN